MSASRIALAAFVAAFAGFLGIGVSAPSDGPSEAPASFQMVTNGFVSQADFLDALGDFSEEASAEPGDEGGLGPTYNGVSCKSCHLNPVAGGGLSRFELRAGRLDAITGSFIAPPGGTLVRQLATDPAAQQRVPEGFFTTKRRSTSLFGLGFVELIPDRDILAVRDAQPPEVRGVATTVQATTGISRDGTLTQVAKVGRFGWKCQQGTLLDFSADALVNEISRTNPINPNEPAGVDGRSLAQFKKTADPEDAPTVDRPFGHDTVSYMRFMRSLQAPPPDFALSATDDAISGGRLFVAIGCAQCHVQSFTTAAVGLAPAGLDKADPARGGKVIHPLSDFLLHDIGTGDTEVVQGGDETTRKMLRTAPLWGVRLIPEMGHDGRWTTFTEAIRGHAGQASGSSARFFALSSAEQKQLLAYLRSR